MKLRNAIAVLTLAAALAAPAQAEEAEEVQTFRITNHHRTEASDVHVVFADEGRGIGKVVARAASCPGEPTQKQEGPTVDLDWGEPCIGNGDSVELEVSSQDGRLWIGGGYWTRGGTPMPGSRFVLKRDVEELRSGPFCCKYVCFDSQLRPYVIELCNDVTCKNEIAGPGEHVCNLQAAPEVADCDQCPSRVLGPKCQDEELGTPKDD